MKAVFIPYYMVETGEARREFPTYAAEMSVFYHLGMDWFYLCVKCCDSYGYRWDARRN